MAIVIGIHFTGNSKLYYFDPSEVWPAVGDGVICDTSRGPEYGVVATSAREIDDSLLQSPLRKVTALATEDDMKRVKSNRELSRHALKVCKEKILLHKLDMKLIDVEVAFDMSKIVFFFTANERVDFRELVKDLASQFKTRIEMRQIGVRDEARILGGLGPCGRDICCRSYLNAFQPVSIKMAKEQNLALNPTKISGLCGRLMCCLKNEEEVYEELNRKLPGVGDVVEAADGTKGEVHSVSILKQLVKVVVTLPGDEKEIREFPADDLTIKLKRKEKNRQRQEEMQHAEELKALEKKEKGSVKENEGGKEENRHRDRRPRNRHRGPKQEGGRNGKDAGSNA